MTPDSKFKMLGATIVAGAFLLLALGGSFVTSRHMNKTADEQAMSAGRPGDAQPDGLQEQQLDKSARGPSTTGAPATATVPAAR
jgi:hypothetical protein